MSDMVETESKLRQWRRSKGKTQADCAKLVGVTRQTWANWEAGRAAPTRPKLIRLKAITAGFVCADDFYQQLSDVA